MAAAIAGLAGILARIPRGLRVRIVSALVLAPVALVIIYLGGVVWLLMVAGVGWLVHREWRAVTGAPGLVGSLAMLVLTWAGAVALHYGDADLGWALAGLGFGAAVLAALAGRGSPLWAGAGAAYVILPTQALVTVREAGPESVIWLFLVVWATDTGAYLAGSQIGGPKLWARVSPNKTWAGALGGALIGAGAGALLAWLAGEDEAVGAALVLGAVIAIVAQLGDLAESAWKRHFKVKDSGGIIPGHGGVMDRIDGLIAAAVALAVIIRLDGVSI